MNSSVLFQVCTRVGVWPPFPFYTTVYKDIFSKTRDPMLFMRDYYYLQSNWLVAKYIMSKTEKGEALIHPLCDLILTFQATFWPLLLDPFVYLPMLWIFFICHSCIYLLHDLSLASCCNGNAASRCSLYPRAESYITAHKKSSIPRYLVVSWNNLNII